MNERPDEIQQLTYLFSGTVAATSRNTLVSTRIPWPFRTKRIDAYFPVGTNRLNQISIFVSNDDAAPTAAEPEGDNIMAARGNVTYIVGNDERRTFDHEVVYMIENSYLKVHANNTDGIPHTVDVTITIARIHFK